MGAVTALQWRCNLVVGALSAIQVLPRRVTVWWIFSKLLQHNARQAHSNLARTEQGAWAVWASIDMGGRTLSLSTSLVHVQLWSHGMANVGLVRS